MGYVVEVEGARCAPWANVTRNFIFTCSFALPLNLCFKINSFFLSSLYIIYMSVIYVVLPIHLIVFKWRILYF